MALEDSFKINICPCPITATDFPLSVLWVHFLQSLWPWDLLFKTGRKAQQEKERVLFGLSLFSKIFPGISHLKSFWETTWCCVLGEFIACKLGVLSAAQSELEENCSKEKEGQQAFREHFLRPCITFFFFFNLLHDATEHMLSISLMTDL